MSVKKPKAAYGSPSLKIISRTRKRGTNSSFIQQIHEKAFNLLILFLHRMLVLRWKDNPVGFVGRETMHYSRHERRQLTFVGQGLIGKRCVMT